MKMFMISEPGLLNLRQAIISTEIFFNLYNDIFIPNN